MNRALIVVALAASVTPPLTARAVMGPCKADPEANLICGEGNGAARVIAKTISPSKRFALAWRLTNGPLSRQPNDHDPDVENVVVRIENGDVIVKTHGSYWENGVRQAKANVFAAWSPGEGFLVAGVEYNDSETGEIFAFNERGAVIGPFDVVKAIEPAVRAEMMGVKDVDKYSLRFSYMPQITINDQGLMHASAFMSKDETDDDKIYEVTAQATQTAGTLSVKVLSVSQYLGPYISVRMYHGP
jgi:hypothetical protein